MTIAILSDLHANLQALNAVLEDLPAVDELWCLGDLVGYGSSPNQVVETLLRRKPAVVLLGNHDAAALDLRQAEGFNPLAWEAARWTGAVLDPATRSYLQGLAPRLDRADLCLAHASPRDPLHEYVFDEWIAAQVLESLSGRNCMVGHTHVPMLATEQAESSGPPGSGRTPLPPGPWLINPGSVGQPRDGDPRAAYALVDPERGWVEFHRVAYDVAGAQQGIRQAGLPRPLADRLSLGM